METGQLSIAAGRHSGAVVALSHRPVSVGTDTSCDIILSDTGLEPHHFTLHQTVEGTLVTARDGTVWIDDETEIAPGFRAMVRGTLTLDAGPVRLDVVLPAEVTGRRNKMLLPMLVGASVLFGAQAAGTATGQTPALAMASAAASTASPADLANTAVRFETPATTEVLPTEVAVAIPVPDIEPPAASTQAVRVATLPVSPPSPPIAEAVAARLSELGLDALVARAEDGVVTVTGTVAMPARPAWGDFQRWFDARWPSTVLQSGNVVLTPAEEADPVFPAIQSVWTMGGAPYVVIGGTRVRVGNAIDGDWTLTAIDGASVTLRRGDREWRLDLIDASIGGSAINDPVVTPVSGVTE